MKKIKNNLNYYIRIIGGKWRKKRLYIKYNDNLRPTKDRIRETLFNWLNNCIANSSCLDCFAGSGILGIESLSRYANNVTFLEINSMIFNQLKKNISILKASNTKLIYTNTIEYLNSPGKPYNIVFIDPPFKQGIVQKTLNLLDSKGWLANNALIYVENEIESTLFDIPASWSLYNEKLTKRIAYRLYYKK